jgi:hypothetical protein
MTLNTCFYYFEKIEGANSPNIDKTIQLLAQQPSHADKDEGTDEEVKMMQSRENTDTDKEVIFMEESEGEEE